MNKLARYFVLMLLSLALMESGAIATGDWPIISLGEISDSISAANAVEEQIRSMGDIGSVDEANFVADYADAAICKAATIVTSDNTVEVSRQTVAVNRLASTNLTLEETALEARRNAEMVMREDLAAQGNSDYHEAVRGLFSTVAFQTLATGKITVIINPDIRNTNVDVIKVETPLYALSFSPAVLGSELAEQLIITMENVSKTAYPEVKVTMSNKSLASALTLSLPTSSSDLTDMAVMDAGLTAFTTRRNTITSYAEGMIFTDGTYNVGFNGSDFQDIQHLSQETQKAIRTMAARGITSGTTATTVSPDAPITRGQFVTFLMRSLGTRDSWNKANHFYDVNKNIYCYAYANAAAENGFISGYSDGTFRPNKPLLKQQICQILGNVLRKRYNANVPSNRDVWLRNYHDGVINYARDSVAILTWRDYISYYPDYQFHGEHEMTRAEMALLLYRTLLK